VLAVKICLEALRVGYFFAILDFLPTSQSSIFFGRSSSLLDAAGTQHNQALARQLGDKQAQLERC
jgi:hypothetical protein